MYDPVVENIAFYKLIKDIYFLNKFYLYIQYKYINKTKLQNISTKLFNNILKT